MSRAEDRYSGDMARSAEAAVTRMALEWNDEFQGLPPKARADTVRQSLAVTPFHDEWVAHKSIVDLADGLARAGWLQEALLALDILIDRNASSQDDAALLRVASALNQQGLHLRHSGHLDEALSTFEAVQSVAARAGSGEDGRETLKAMALFNAGIVHEKRAHQTGDTQAFVTAIDTYFTLTEIDHRSEPQATDLVSQGLYNAANDHAYLGEFERARQIFAEVAEHFEDHESATSRWMGRLARARAALLGDFWVPATPHIPDHPALIEQQNRRSGALSPRGWLRRLADDAGRREENRRRRIERNHQDAVAILRSYQGGGVPFVLYLRSFDLEAVAYETPRGVVGYSLVGRHPIEEELHRLLSGGVIHVVGIGNPWDTMDAEGDVFPRLYLPNHAWKEVVNSLIAAAPMVVLALDRLTPGVREELRFIATAAKADRTVVVAADDADEWQETRRSLYDYSGLSTVSLEPVRLASSELHQFSHKLTEAQFAPESPEFERHVRPLLVELGALAQEDPETRLMRRLHE
jgi:tetratricopeptide (TPR) repeat protein